MASWDSSRRFKRDSEAFLFSIDKDEKFEILDAESAIYCD